MRFSAEPRRRATPRLRNSADREAESRRACLPLVGNTRGRVGPSARLTRSAKALSFPRKGGAQNTGLGCGFVLSGDDS